MNRTFGTALLQIMDRGCGPQCDQAVIDVLHPITLQCDRSAHTVATDNISYEWKLTLGDDIIGSGIREHCPSTASSTLTAWTN